MYEPEDLKSIKKTKYHILGVTYHFDSDFHCIQPHIDIDRYLFHLYMYHCVDKGPGRTYLYLQQLKKEQQERKYFIYPCLHLYPFSSLTLSTKNATYTFKDLYKL